jgi:hypothetical protein
LMAKKDYATIEASTREVLALIQTIKKWFQISDSKFQLFDNQVIEGWNLGLLNIQNNVFQLTQYENNTC